MSTSITRRSKAIWALSLSTILSIVSVTVLEPVAYAGAGSLVTGNVWSDLNRNQALDTGELNRAGVTVRLVNGVTNAIITTTTTDASGVYSFAGVADGNYKVQVVAPSTMKFPVVASGGNSFSEPVPPPAGQPDVGSSTAFVIAGATQRTGLNASLQPHGTLSVVLSPQSAPSTPALSACDGLINTGTATFDATDGSGKDSSAANCLVRTRDSSSFLYSVSLSGLPSGVTVSPVVAKFVVSSPDGARLKASLPAGCLGAPNSPVSGVATSGGVVTVTCNLGSSGNAVTPVQLKVETGAGSPDGSTYTVSASASSPSQDAASDPAVTSPSVQSTNTPDWNIRQSVYSGESIINLTVNGVTKQYYTMTNRVDFSSRNTKGSAALQGPISFDFAVPNFPTAVAWRCRKADGNTIGYYGPAHPGSCIVPGSSVPAGADGLLPITLSGFDSNTYASDTYLIDYAIPVEDVYRAIDPTWQTGNPAPYGTAANPNSLVNTDGWADALGRLNAGSGFEAGWDGTAASGDNVTSQPITISPPPLPPGGAVTGTKTYSSNGPLIAGQAVTSTVSLTTNSTGTVTNPMVCDVFDSTTQKLDSLPTAPAGYAYEYAAAPANTNTQNGARLASGYFPYDSTDIKNLVAGCATYAGPWTRTPATTIGANWSDTVNMVRLVPTTNPTTLAASTTLTLRISLRVRPDYVGGPLSGQRIPTRIYLVNEGGWSNPYTGGATNWSTREATTTYIRDHLNVSLVSQYTQYQPGQDIAWRLNLQPTLGVTGDEMPNTTARVTLGANQTFNAVATQAALPDGVTFTYDSSTKVITFFYGTLIVGTPEPAFDFYTTVSSLAPSGTSISASVTATAPNSLTSVQASDTITVNSPGRLGLTKTADRDYTRPGTTYNWNITWGNTATNVDYSSPDLIDVLPWNGDAADGALSKRDQFDSSYTGTNNLVGPLAQPTVTSGGSGNVAGTWYYTTAIPATVNHDPRDSTNANPGSAGSIWKTSAEISSGAGFGAVTAVRFVSSAFLLRSTQVTATIPMAATSATLNNRYVNKSMIYSATFPTQPVLSNDAQVQIPGYSIGDLVWIDKNGDGVFNNGETGVSGLVVNVLDASNNVVGTATTNSEGRWLVAALPEGTYRVQIPASAFQPGGLLAGYQVRTAGSSTSSTGDEDVNNNNTAAANPVVSGLVSSPVTFTYQRNASNFITGGGQPAGDNIANLGDDNVQDSFTNFTIDLAAAPISNISIIKSVDEISPSAGQTITFTLIATNTGTSVLSNVTITDTGFSGSGTLGALDCGTPATTVLLPGDQTSCTATYTVTQADIDSGALRNTANVVGTPAFGANVTATDTLVMTGVPSASFAFEKSIGTWTDVNSNSIVDSGDTLAYVFDITNTGNVSLSSQSVSDPLLAGTTITCVPSGRSAPGPITPGQIARCTSSAPYTITQADADAGVVNNTASASAVYAGNTVGPVTDSNTQTVDRVATYTVDKSSVTTDSNSDGSLGVGDTLRYSVLITNTGTVTLSNIQLSDPKLSGLSPAITFSCPKTTLVAGESETCTTDASYTITQADVDAGSVQNVASVSVSTPTGVTAPDAVTGTDDVLITRTALFVVTKTAATPVDVNGNGLTDAGDTIAYTLAIQNTGNVTLTNPVISDPLLTGAGITFICPSSSIAPGQTLTCNADPYSITQAQVDAGNVRNTASASLTPPAGVPDPIVPASNVDTPIVGQANYTLAKSAATPVDVNSNSKVDAGDKIRYSFTVRNTGTVTLTNVGVSDPKLSGITITCASTSLAPGASTNCTTSADYVITQADVDGGMVHNVATATATPPAGVTAPTSPTSALDTPTTSTASLTLQKTQAATVDANNNSIVGDAGDTISYSFQITNTGTVTLSAVSINDPLLTGITISCASPNIAPGQSIVCTTSAPYVITQADVDAGKVVNDATASASAPVGVTAPTDATATVTRTTSSSASFSFVKSAGTPVDVNSNSQVDAGDTVAYTFVVSNTGTVTLSSFAVTDTKLASGVSCPTTPVAPGGTATCTGNAPYVITQADVDSGNVHNTATATAAAPAGITAPDPVMDSNDVPTSGTATYSFVKSGETPVDVNANGNVDAGDTINYTFVVSNTGPVTLSGLTVTDAKVGTVTCPTTTLAPQASTTCTASPYVIKQSDVDSGNVHNVANVHVSAPVGARQPQDMTSTYDQETTSSASYTFVKQAAAPVDANANNITDAGDTISYTFVVTNTGTVTLSGLSIADPKLLAGGITVVCPATTLAAGASITCAASGAYSITQADVNAGSVQNSATAHASAPSGIIDPADQVSSTDTPITRNAGLSLSKTGAATVDANRDGIVGNTGDTIAYRFVATNNGNVTLSTLVIDDTKLSSQSLSVVCPITTLNPGQSVTCTASGIYAITQGDVDNGSVDNTATATATSPSGVTDPTPATANHVRITDDSASISLAKTADSSTDVNVNSIVDAGDTIGYSFRVSNTGSVSLNNINITDANLPAGVTCPIGDLAPGAYILCTSTSPYTINQSDVDAGQVDNTATVSATTPGGSRTVTADDSNHFGITGTASFTFEKLNDVPVDVNGNSKTDTGDTINYTFQLKNTGSLTLMNIEVTDTKLAGQGITIDCANAASLEPGQTAICRTSLAYTITQEDVDGLAVLNTATATATSTDPDITPAEARDDNEVPVDSISEYTLAKSADAPVDVNGNGMVDAGDTIQYHFAVTNTGTVTLDSVTITDPKLEHAGIEVDCPNDSLLPGATADCSATSLYTITQADVDAGSVENSATAHATAPQGVVQATDPISENQQESNRVASFTLDKSGTTPADVNGNGRIDAGDTILYSFVLANTGTVTISTLTVIDDKLAAQNILIQCQQATLEPGASTNCITSGPYSISQSDVDAGNVHNAAVGTATAPEGVTPPSSVTAIHDQETTTVASLSMTKDAAGYVLSTGNTEPGLGDTVTYVFTVTNTGTVTLTEVKVSDPLLAGQNILVTCAENTLLPGQTTECTPGDRYKIAQTDVDKGEVLNTATSTGTPPIAGTPVTDAEASKSIFLSQKPSVTLELTANPPVDVNGNGRVDVGDTIDYVFTVKNTGNVNLEDFEFESPALASQGITVVCPSSPLVLAPGETVVCRASKPYTITAADQAAGKVVNNTSLVAKTSGGTDASVVAASDVTQSIDAALPDGSSGGSGPSGLASTGFDGGMLWWVFAMILLGSIMIGGRRFLSRR